MKRINKHIRRWNLWRKHNTNGFVYKFFVLVGLAYSPTFADTLLPEEMTEVFKCLGMIRRNPMEWISVEDRLPEEDGKYLVARLEGNLYSISVRKFRKDVPDRWSGYCGHWEKRTNGITHWMYLPEPPNS